MFRYLLLAVVTMSTAASLAQKAGSIDTSFGTQGLASHPQGPVWAIDMEVLSDDFFMVLGIETDHIYLYKFTPDGAPETSFGNNGQLLLSVAPDSIPIPLDLLIDDFDRMYIGGYSSAYMFIMRLNPDGIRDSSFASNGMLQYPFVDTFRWVAKMAFTPAGNLAFTGAVLDTGGLSSIGLGLIDTNGVPVPSFGNNGEVHFEVMGSDCRGKTLHVQDDGRILIGGMATPGSYSLTVWSRHLADGSFDTTFGTQGIAAFPFLGPQNSEQLETSLLMPDGSVISGVNSSGWTGQTNYLFRLDSNGVIDTLPGKNGLVIVDSISFSFIADLMLQSDTAIVLAGRRQLSILAQRYHLDLQLDTSFNHTGTTLIPLNMAFNSARIRGQQDKLLISTAALDAGTYHNVKTRLYCSTSTPSQTVELVGSGPVIAPNPFRDNISITLLKSAPAVVSLYDMQGVLVYRNVLATVDMNQKILVPDRLRNGLYWMEIQQAGQSWTSAVMRAR